MKNSPTPTSSDPSIAEIVSWFGDVGIQVADVRSGSCPRCAEEAAAA